MFKDICAGVSQGVMEHWVTDREVRAVVSCTLLSLGRRCVSKKKTQNNGDMEF